MKKLLLLATSLSCIAATAEGLSSANIVGWSDKELVAASSESIAPYFFRVGELIDKNSFVKLSDLTVAGYADNYCPARVNIQLLDSVGRASATYYWCEGVNGKEAAGWYDRSGSFVSDANGNNVAFKQGAALWVHADAGMVLKQAGEVFLDDVTFALAKGSQMLGNPYAAPLKLSDLKVKGYAGNYAAAIVDVQFLDKIGRTTATYYWCEGVASKENPGWYDRSGNLVCDANGNDVVLAAGKGLWVHSNVDGLFIEALTPLQK